MPSLASWSRSHARSGPAFGFELGPIRDLTWLLATKATHSPCCRVGWCEKRSGSSRQTASAPTRLTCPAAVSRHTPCVVMANGVGMTRRDGIPRFAKRFADSGIAALAFDFRHLGDSDGEPRQLIDVHRHRADFAAAMEFARSIEGIDCRRVAVWGFSFGEGCACDGDRRPQRGGGDPALSDARRPRVHSRWRCLQHRCPSLRCRATSLCTARDANAAAHRCTPGRRSSSPSRRQRQDSRQLEGEGSLWKNEVRFDPTRPVTHFGLLAGSGRARCPLLVCLGIEDTIVPARPIEGTACHGRRGRTSPILDQPLHRVP